MQIQEFISDLELHFPLNCKVADKGKLIKSYVENIANYMKGKEDRYDLQKVLTYLLQNYKYAKLPPLAEIIECLPYGLKEKDNVECIDAGKILVVTLPSGYKYDFVISSCGKPKDEVLAKLYKRFGKCQVDIYPAGTCLIGNEVILP